MTKEPIMPCPLAMYKLADHTLFKFRCDDHNGYLLCIFLASDGDLHITIEADPDHEGCESNCQRVSGSVRLRMPFIGGSHYDFLHPALIEAIKNECKKYNIPFGENSSSNDSETTALQDEISELAEELDILNDENYKLKQIIQNAYNYVPFSGICPICSIIIPGQPCHCKAGQYSTTNPSVTNN